MPARKTKNRGRPAKTTRRPARKKTARRRAAPQPLVGFIGAGNMARSLAGGLLRNGWARNRLILSDPDAAQRAAVEKVLKLKTYATNNDVAARADILVLAVKPQVLRTAALELTETVQSRRPFVVSVAAGVRLADLERWLGGGLPIVRVMPNTAALIGSGAAGLYANPRVTPGQRDQAESILRSVGVTVWLGDEALLDVVTAVSGSGPAYFFRVMEALERAAVEEGLDRATARLLTLETAFGAAKMALEGGEEPAVLRTRVTSPGGTTEQALAVLETGGIEKLFHQAVRAATQRARELAEMFGKGGA